MEFLTSSICTIVKVIDEADPDFLEALVWVKENIDHFEYQWHQGTSDRYFQRENTGHFIFFEEADVVAFKLRWL